MWSMPRLSNDVLPGENRLSFLTGSTALQFIQELLVHSQSETIYLPWFYNETLSHIQSNAPVSGSIFCLPLKSTRVLLVDSLAIRHNHSGPPF